MPGSVSRREALSRALAVSTLAAAAPAWAARGDAGDAAARAVLTRLFGPAAARIALTLEPAGARPWYAAEVRNGALSVHGDTPVALARGAYAWMRQTGAAHVSWEGDRTALPARLPDGASGRVESPFAHRAYLNPCTYGYTTPWWDWPRWRREIDWMAVHGIDMPLALEGQEFVWRALWREMGLTEAELAGYFSGPAFTPWQRMGNIEGYRAPLPAAWIDKKRDLQRRILGAMRALGMSPILPAFGGYVPKAFALKHADARIYRMPAGGGFHETYWLDPRDPLFAKLAARFLALYTETYGSGTYYLADSFNEMRPPVADDGTGGGNAGFADGGAGKAAAAQVDPALKARRLAAYGKAIHAAFHAARPDAVWVMQGWLFGADSQFWDEAAIAAYFSEVPDGGVMVLDIGNDRYPDVWRRARAFAGKPWIFGYVHNYGASNPVYGDLEGYRRDLAAVLADPQAGRLAGFGLFPEGLDNNSIVYEEAYDLAWGAGGASLSAWLSGYAKSRYGRTTPELDAALRQLADAAYTTRYWSPRWWNGRAGAYLFCKRPTATIGEFPGHPGDRAKLAAAVAELARMAPAFAGEPLFVHDLIDATGHLVSEEIDLLLQAAVAAYRRGDLAAGDRARRKAEDLALALDALLGAQPDTLATWIDAARAYADNPADARAYVLDAKAQVTVWGGDGGLADYASKAWQGLYGDFYLPRWSQFLDALRAAGAGPFDEAAVVAGVAAWEQAWVERDTAYVRRRPADPVGGARALLARLGRP
ncbi:MAG TPA: alpha-N-acetylglucosaminidase [Phenylobacterium sp.]|jgi:alpha-N-acetylglucosaminidase|uniref:alpha-N-acetylglucosaminidase n=1 Tax=Phenylobacterium sp. TaxID=1871053 RepID=UPI002B6CDB68|nr:alpha-N-acetylglucosaminidase [Phenylobacterium sp.]HXA39798.1 alpha-N-acetylglucosaminidase [Phenylobacterium sp.]